LGRLLKQKGLLTEAEARAITANASAAEQRDRLAVLLRDKGVLSPAEFEALLANTSSPTPRTITADYQTTSPNPSAATPQPTPAKVIAAVAPTRLLGIDVPKREGVIPDVDLGTSGRLQLYRLLKISY